MDPALGQGRGPTITGGKPTVAAHAGLRARHRQVGRPPAYGWTPDLDDDASKIPALREAIAISPSSSAEPPSQPPPPIRQSGIRSTDECNQFGVRREQWISGKELQRPGHRLCDQQAVKWITVIQR